MIRSICREEIPEAVNVIRESFLTVAEMLGLTPENAPRFTAFSTTHERLTWQFDAGRIMRVYEQDGRIAGYYSLDLQDAAGVELNNLCVLPAYRHSGIGACLLEDAFRLAREKGCSRVHIGIVEENRVLRRWHEAAGFVHTGTKKFDFFPFTCGYMEKTL